MNNDGKVDGTTAMEVEPSTDRIKNPFPLIIAVFPILADAVDVKRGDQLCETVSQPSIQPDKVVRPMGS